MTSSNPQNAGGSEPPRKRQRISVVSPPQSRLSTTANPTPVLEEDTKMDDTYAEERGQEATRVAMETVTKQVVTSDTGFQPEREQQVGILCFVNEDRLGFTGTLKQRYTDFLVNEIAPDGTVVHLTDDRVPKFKDFNKQDTTNEDRKPLANATNATEAKGESSTATAELKPEDLPLPPPTPSEVATAPLDDVAPSASTEIPVPEAHLPTENDKPSSSTKDDDDSSKQETEKAAFVISPQDQELLTKYFGAALKDEIVEFHEKILAKPKAKPSTFDSLFSEPIIDRPLRGNIHQAIRRIFGSRIDTESMPDTGKIQFSAAPPQKPHPEGYTRDQNSEQKSNKYQNPRKQTKGQPKGKLGWQELGGEHLHFSLYKENKDTMEVISYMCSMLKVKPREFAFAGTKDRRAVTVQRVSVYRQNAKALQGLNKTLRQARIGDFKYEKHRLELGELDGNQFNITLRDCHFGEDDSALDDSSRLQLANDVVGQSVKGLQSDGFLNYFGLQRFGSFGIGTHEVGKKILKDDFEGAVWAILDFSQESLQAAKQRDGYSDNARAVRISRDDLDRALGIDNFKTTGKSQFALDKIPYKFSAERTIIRELGLRPTNFLGALENISRNLKTMYVHAHQSLVWNIVASERWSRYGSKVIKGDLVLVDTPAEQAAKTRDEVDENGEVVIHAAADDSALTHDDLYQRARSLTAEEAQSGQYTIFDVVLPTPGYDIEYPGNEIGDFYKEFMNSERGGGLDPGDMRRKVKDFSLSGSYRKLIAQFGKALSFEIKAYKDENKQLVETDLEKLERSRGQDPHAFQNARNDNSGGNHGTQNGRGGRGGRNDFYNNRGNRGGHQNGSYGNRYTDIRQENVQSSKPAPPSFGNMDGAAKAAAMAGWQNLPAKLAADDKAAAAKYAATPLRDPDTIEQPRYKDTFIQTSAENEGRRTGFRTTDYFDADGNITKEPEVKVTPVAAEDAPNGESDKPTTIASHGMEVDTGAPESLPAAKIDESFNSVADSSDGGVALSAPAAEASIIDEPEPPTKIAVIIKFDLGTSQYATMALRELMKLGGVKTYKPDFSMGR